MTAERVASTARSLYLAAQRKVDDSCLADAQDLLNDGEFGLALDVLVAGVDGAHADIDLGLLAAARRLAPGIIKTPATA